MKTFIQYVIGGVIGIMLLLIGYYFVQYYRVSASNKNDTPIISNRGIKVDTIQSGSYKIEIKQDNEVKVKSQNEIFEERIKSLNDRLSDMYLSLGIIVTLVLAVVASVYFKTESEVAKHMNNNFAKYKQDIIDLYSEAQNTVSQIKANADLSQQILLKQNTDNENQSPE